jgi:hypothetical protein
MIRAIDLERRHDARLLAELNDAVHNCCEANNVQCNQGTNCPVRMQAASACSELLADDDTDALAPFRGLVNGLGITAAAAFLVWAAWQALRYLT